MTDDPKDQPDTHPDCKTRTPTLSDFEAAGLRDDILRRLADPGQSTETADTARQRTAP
jgi:hypothetical protein